MDSIANIFLLKEYYKITSQEIRYYNTVMNVAGQDLKNMLKGGYGFLKNKKHCL